ncbi:hypothetical protein GGX14DRAFT_573821 [Mycena pura]|uniref:Uncharacterized protein n=1 Tax=Mycena pura TaxID=153505 RepID=A0AAD6UZ48_9AGAR|nr:hypothetical protein GGX14DRAFT_573821 [Mycena pura]
MLPAPLPAHATRALHSQPSALIAMHAASTFGGVIHCVSDHGGQSSGTVGWNKEFRHRAALVKTSVPATAILALVNQTFQSWRVYVFTENKVLVGILFIAALTAFAMGAAASVQSLLLQYLELRKLVPLQPVVEGNLSLQCALDAIIAGDIYMHFTIMDHLNTREQLRDLLPNGGLPVSVSND